MSSSTPHVGGQPFASHLWHLHVFLHQHQQHLQFDTIDGSLCFKKLLLFPSSEKKLLKMWLISFPPNFISVVFLTLSWQHQKEIKL